LRGACQHQRRELAFLGRRLPIPQPSPHPICGPHQGDVINQLIRHGGDRFLTMPGQECFLRGEGLGRPFRSQVADVGRKQALAQQILAAGQIAVPGRGQVPPCLRPLVMESPGPHGHAGFDVEPRLQGIAMEDEAVDAFAEGPVADLLDTHRR